MRARQPQEHGPHGDRARHVPEDQQLAVVPIPGLELDQVGDKKHEAEGREQQPDPAAQGQRAEQGQQQQWPEQAGVLDPEPRRPVRTRYPANQPAGVLVIRRRAGVTGHRHQQPRHGEHRHHGEETKPGRPRKEQRPAHRHDAKHDQAVHVEQRQHAGQPAGGEEGDGFALDRPAPPRPPDRAGGFAPLEEGRGEQGRGQEQQDRHDDRRAENERSLREVVGKDGVVPLDVDRLIEPVVGARNLQQRIDQTQSHRVAEEEPEADASAEQGEGDGDRAGPDPPGEPPRPEDQSAERQDRHPPAGPRQRRRDAPSARDQQRAGEVGRKRIAEGRPREDRIVRRQVLAVDEGGGVAGVERPVGPGVVVVGEPGLRGDLHRAQEQIPHGQRDDGDRGRNGDRGGLRPWLRRDRAAQLRKAAPQEEPARDQTKQREQEDEPDGYPDRERKDVAQQRQCHHRQHDASHRALAPPEPRRPARGQAKAEDQTAGDER